MTIFSMPFIRDTYETVVRNWQTADEKVTSSFQEAAPTLHSLTSVGLGLPAQLSDLRTVHAELRRMDIYPVVDTAPRETTRLTLTLLNLPREDPNMLVGFVIPKNHPADETLASRYVMRDPPRGTAGDGRGKGLFSRDRSREIRSLNKMIQDAVPGDRLVVVGVTVEAFGRVVDASGVYRVITLT
ncbi:hypothetical protein ACMT4L_03040 [Deinococcus sp. A31D244]|uniref:hypothetical protein n=1 Tax=Deinococcus sp. A31D244 TaxID=3397675 RepID=UPI0039DF4FCE